MDVGLALIEAAIELATRFNQFACGIVFALADTLTVVFPLFLLVAIVNLVGRRWVSAWARQFLWTLVLIRLIIPICPASPFSAQHLWPLIDFVVFMGAERVPFVLLEKEDTSLFRDLRLAPRTKNSWPAPSEFSFTSLTPQLTAVARPIIVMGALLIAGVYAFGLRRLFGWMRYGRLFDNPAVIDEVLNAKRSLGIGAKILVRTVHQVPGAVTFDWFRPTILLPEAFESYPPAERKLIVWHETARIRRADSATTILLAIVRMIQWWNPLFWWAQRCWTLEREIACDHLVISHVGTEHIEEYAKTLEQAHQARKKQSWFMIDDVPGFVPFVQPKSILPQRLRALTRANRPESRFCHWFSWCVVCGFAVIGLTDAAKRPPQETPIQLPTGTTWHDVLATDVTSIEMETRTYDLSACISLATQEHQGWPVDAAVEQFRTSIRHLLKITPLTESSLGTTLSGGAGTAAPLVIDANRSDISPESQCDLNGHQLIVRASIHQHDLVSRLISEWSRHGLKQLTMEFRTITTSVELSQLLPSVGGKIFNSEFVVDSQMPMIHNFRSSSPTVHYEHAIRSPTQVFIRRLSAAEAKHLVDEAQNNPRSNLLFAPKVTIFHGQSATVSDQRQRPFVTGFKSGEDGFDPIVTTVKEGAAFKLFAFAEEDKVFLHTSFRVSEISDVQVRSLRTDSQVTRLQVPHLQELFVHANAEMASEETLLIVPLQRDAQGQLTFFLITPRIIEETGF